MKPRPVKGKGVFQFGWPFNYQNKQRRLGHNEPAEMIKLGGVSMQKSVTACYSYICVVYI
jgi:hypothetical protein